MFEAGTGWDPKDTGKIIKREAASVAGYTVLSKKTSPDRGVKQKSSIEGMGLKEYKEITRGISVLIGSVEKPYGVLVVHSTKEEKFTKEDAYFFVRRRVPDFTSF
ncbi:hypothetical protein [Methanosarcina horonobensis]|uniref:hypothetical protein n=1 Tax=Methanosarcina horonobensis TaxID=418008 RepID=UPI002FCE4A74